MLRSILAAVLCLGCHRAEAAKSSSPDCVFESSDSGPAGTVAIRAETVVTGLEVPWAIGFLPDGDFLVTERPGRVRLVHDGKLDPHAVASIEVAPGAEGGLLGLAVDPAFSSNRLYYVYATVKGDSGPVNRILRLRLSEDRRTTEAKGVVVDGIRAAQYHDGGRLRFGPDGMLYAATGDARVPELAQKRDSLNGKILRMRTDGSAPADNPIAGSLVFISGLRNPEGFDWLDASTLVLVDHGPSGEFNWQGNDEVNIARRGENLGWPALHGCRSEKGMVSPVLSFSQAVPPGGAALYAGSSIPEWNGSLLVGTLRSKHLHRVMLDAGRKRAVGHEVYLLGDPPAGFGRLREVVMGPDGQLYVTTSNCDGRGTCPADKDRILRLTR